MSRNLPSILNDRQIRELCETPSFEVSEVVDWLPNTDGILTIAHSVIYQSNKTREELHLAEATHWNKQSSHSTGVVGFRDLTEEEKEKFQPMISPFEATQVRTREVDLTRGHSGEKPFCGPTSKQEKIISYGLSSHGYDVRLGRKFKIFSNIKSVISDPLNMSDDCYVDHEGDFCIIPPNSYILGYTIETFNMPRDVIAICLGKSTYARAGAAINVTPIEAGFCGQVVIEISNLTPLPLKVHAEMGIAQFLFLRSSEPCEVSYADRAGKYQNQTGITTAKV